MAQREIVRLIDDIDGQSDAAETVTFGLDGVLYEIDLTADHAEDIRAELDAYVTAARQTSGPARRRHASASAKVKAPTVDYAPTVVRQWALDQGIEVNARGRVPNDVIEQFRAAQETTEVEATLARGRRTGRGTR